MIENDFYRQKVFFENKLTESFSKSKDLRKALKYLGLSSKTPLIGKFSFEKLKTVQNDFYSILKDFRTYYSTLVENLVKMLPKLPKKYTINTVIRYYEHMILGDYLLLASAYKN